MAQKISKKTSGQIQKFLQEISEFGRHFFEWCWFHSKIFIFGQVMAKKWRTWGLRLLSLFVVSNGGHSRQILKKCWGSQNFDRPEQYVGGVYLAIFCIISWPKRSKKRSQFLKSFYLVKCFKKYILDKSPFYSVLFAFLRYISEKGPFHLVR